MTVLGEETGGGGAEVLSDRVGRNCRPAGRTGLLVLLNMPPAATFTSAPHERRRKHWLSFRCYRLRVLPPLRRFSLIQYVREEQTFHIPDRAATVHSTRAEKSSRITPLQQLATRHDRKSLHCLNRYQPSQTKKQRPCLGHVWSRLGGMCECSWLLNRGQAFHK